jgi:Sensors of blue-light using FAD
VVYCLAANTPYHITTYSHIHQQQASVMIQATYISTPTRSMSTEDLMQILNSARQNNIRLGVSGMLLFTGSEFIQILEGEEKIIEELLAKIKQDPRHGDIRIIEKKKITTREYADWTMGFKHVDKNDLRDIPGLNKFFDTDLSGEIDHNKLKLINNLLNHFRNKEKKKISTMNCLWIKRINLFFSCTP